MEVNCFKQINLQDVKSWISNKPGCYFAGVAGLTALYGLYRALKYLTTPTEDEYLQRLKTVSNPEERRILIIGLDKSGKHRFARSFCKVEGEETTVGPYIKSDFVLLGEIFLKLWYVSGSPEARRLWRDFFNFHHMDAICFCVDASQPSRFVEARKELHRVLHHKDTSGIPLILVATKQDKVNAVSPFVLQQTMNLDIFQGTRTITAVGVQLPETGLRKGLMDCYKLFVKSVNKNKKQQ